MSQTPLLGLFDSGVGGFSVYKKIKDMTVVDCIYYGDCLRAPYGNRVEEEIIAFIKDDIKFLKDEGVTHFVNACNSMSVVTTDKLLKECGIAVEHYTDMIRAFERNAFFNGNEKVLIFATNATIRTHVYQDILLTKGMEVLTFAYTDLAFAIENNKRREELLSIIKQGMEYAKTSKATHIVYGCTHYPLVHELFLVVKESVNWQGEFIDPAEFVAEEVKKWNLKGERRFTPYSSKDTPAFINNVIKFL